MAKKRLAIPLEVRRSLVDPAHRQLSIKRQCELLGLHRSLLSQAASRISEGTLLILDLSDIQKKYARKMEYVTDVRDGSQQVISKGYWTCQMAGNGPAPRRVGTDVEGNQIVPLYQALYSQDSPEFSSENDEVLSRRDPFGQNMIALVLAVFYFLAAILDTHHKLKVMAGHVLDCARRVFGVPDFKYYTLGDGLSAIFQRSPGKQPAKPRQRRGKRPAWQISMNFT